MQPSASARDKRGERTRTAILDAASHLIAERGVDGFTMSDVARRAAINRALIYHYYKDRHNLVFQAIRHTVSSYSPVRPAIGPDAIERSTRMHIEHPEIGRFFFQMLLSGRPLPSLSQRMFEAIVDMEEFKQQVAPQSSYDAPIGVVMATLAQLSWPIAREEIARHLGIPLEEADTRFVAQIRWAGAAAMAALRAEPS